jgi:RND family efflux transporter MFP subunit
LAQAEASLALAEDPFTDNDFELVYAQIEQAEASVALAQKQVNETVIRAPFDGTLAELYISEGSMVGSGSPVALFVSDKLEAIVGIEENRISQVYPGQDAALQVSAYPGQDFPGVISSVAPVADQSSHTFTVKVTPIDEDHLLRAGMYADVSLLVEEREGTFLLPSIAVLEENGEQTVFVVDQNNVARRIVVSTGLQDGTQVEIRSGLNGDEQVVVNGYENLQDGMKVNVAQNVTQAAGE